MHSKLLRIGSREGQRIAVGRIRVSTRCESCLKTISNNIKLKVRHPEGRQGASAFFSLRVGLRDLVVNFTVLL
jgi:hypothetical protein